MLDLGIMVKKKATVQHLYYFSIVCSYDKRLQFRTCATAQEIKDKSNSVLYHCSADLDKEEKILVVTMAKQFLV